MDNLFADEDSRRSGRRHDQAIPSRWIVTAAGVSVIALAALLAATGLSIALNGAAFAFAAVGAILLAIRRQCLRPGSGFRPRTAEAAQNALLFIAISLTGAVASYGIAALTDGWVDGDMVLFDRAIGFDWNRLYALTEAHGWLQVGGRIVYASIFASPVILVLSFAMHRRAAAARAFLASFWLAAFICLVLFHWLPTLGPLAYMWTGPIDYMPTSGLYQADLIPLLRERHADPIDLGLLRGLVGPPSFHAASAVLYTLAAWRTHNLRWPLTLLNGLMLLSIPVEGTHYATDVISGMMVAILSWALVRWIEHRRMGDVAERPG